MHGQQTALFATLTTKDNVGQVRIARRLKGAHHCLMGRLGIGIDPEAERGVATDAAATSATLITA